MKLYNTADPAVKPSVVMLVYGPGGIGKTSFTSTAPTPLLADCENGAKYFGLRGIKMDVAQIEKWPDMKEFLELARSGMYETLIIDPIGELMDKLKMFMIGIGDRKLVQTDGSPTMAGWGWLKKTLRDYIKALRDTGKNVIIIAHMEEKQDDQKLVKRPKVETKLSDELVAMVDIVGYMAMVNNGTENKRAILVDPSSDSFIAKDRTGQLGAVIPPEFSQIIEAVQGVKDYKWAKVAKKAPPVAEEPKTAPVEPKGDKVAPVAKSEEKKPVDDIPEFFCEECGNIMTSAEDLFSKRIYKKALCRVCQKLIPKK